MQRLVTVHLGNRYVVFEARDQGAIEAVHDSQRSITSIRLIHNDAKTKDIHDLRERLMLGLHLAINRVDVFLSANDLCHDTFAIQGSGNGGLHFVHHGLAVASRVHHSLRDALGSQRIKCTKGQLLQFAFDHLHPKAVGDGGIKFNGLPGDALALGIRHHPNGAHVVQAICHLDHDDANVLGHGHGHLLKILGLGFVAAGEYFA